MVTKAGRYAGNPIVALRVEENATSGRFSLALSAVSSFVLRARLGPPWPILSSPLTDPAVQIFRSGFFSRDSPLPPRSE